MEVVHWSKSITRCLQALHYRTVGVSVGQFYTAREGRENDMNSSFKIRVSFFFFSAVKTDVGLGEIFFHIT